MGVEQQVAEEGEGFFKGGESGMEGGDDQTYEYTPSGLPCPSPDTHGIEVYVDEKKQTYADLGYRRFNWLNIWTSLLSRISRAAISEVCVCLR